MPGVGQGPSWEEPGSGVENSGDCDDEDGCEDSSGEPEVTPREYLRGQGSCLKINLHSCFILCSASLVLVVAMRLSINILV